MHTSVQLYSRSQWENSVCKVDKEVCACLTELYAANLFAI